MTRSKEDRTEAERVYCKLIQLEESFHRRQPTSREWAQLSTMWAQNAAQWAALSERYGTGASWLAGAALALAALAIVGWVLSHV